MRHSIAIAVLFAAALNAQFAQATDIRGYAHICSSTGKLCATEAPPLSSHIVGGYFSGTATVTNTTTSLGTGTVTETVTNTSTATGTATGTTTGSTTSTDTSTASVIATVTLATSMTFTSLGTVTGLATGTSNLTSTMTNSATLTDTWTRTTTTSGTGTVTAGGTGTATVSGTASVGRTATATVTNTRTTTYTYSQSGTGTVTTTRSFSSTELANTWVTVTYTSLSTATGTGSGTVTSTSTATATQTAHNTVSTTSTGTGTATATDTDLGRETTIVASNPEWDAPLVGHVTATYSAGDVCTLVSTTSVTSTGTSDKFHVTSHLIAITDYGSSAGMQGCATKVNVDSVAQDWSWTAGVEYVAPSPGYFWNGFFSLSAGGVTTGLSAGSHTVDFYICTIKGAMGTVNNDCMAADKNGVGTSYTLPTMAGMHVRRYR